METSYEVVRAYEYYRVIKLETIGKRRRITHVSRSYTCLSHALFFGLPYGKGSKLRRRPELEGGRAVQVWA